MIKTFIFAEEGSIDIDELKERLGDDVLVVPYRQGAEPPQIQQPREPVSQHNSGAYNSLLDLLIEFDEMGFTPTTLCGDAESFATVWKKRLLEEVEKLVPELELCIKSRKAKEILS